jgi:hypothetical protein
MIPEVAGQVRHNPSKFGTVCGQSAVRADIDVSLLSFFFVDVVATTKYTDCAGGTLACGRLRHHQPGGMEQGRTTVCASLPYSEREGGERQRERERERKPDDKTTK